MKQIPLTQNQVTFVDEKDFEFINKFKWRASKAQSSLGKFYVTKKTPRINVKVGKTIYMHRVLMNAKKGQIIDHKDGNGLNNQRSNLRFATAANNARNMAISKRNKTGFKGISWKKDMKKWQVRISFNYKDICIGSFSDKIEAARAYNIAAIKYHGEFARLNVLP